MLSIYLSGNLSVRSLVDVVSKDDFIEGSEYLETVLVAVPKYATRLAIISSLTYRLMCCLTVTL